MNHSVQTAAKVLWDYHCIYDTLQKADVIVGFGSYDLRVAERVVQLYLEGLAPSLLFTGKGGSGTEGLFKTTAAEAFAAIAIERGVPESSVIIEPNATNIGEKISFTREKLGPGAISVIFVTKPHTQHRVQAAAARQWPEAKAFINAPLTPFEDQPTESHTFEMLAHEMVGDLKRILEYPAKGFQIAQAVPLEVMEAYDYLIVQGYDGD
ncbi:YdcF family protein [Falsochrobactrum sp. TDYN1]|uniref:YdcF family protein n=1 Tax=Falsochrobactrum tianjinense TaxID=2706015 RepID=A0A949PLE5_9HYPH|nr:YdcF family protein [Falsochrobactrum sp. TDYN1]MBV2142074.1 YdcF family protein [Falsochrobactrum sp. TDYN1]